ncbi:MAG: hypothetical protein L6408_08690 [Nanoarchaeota archaeon]|nr:hypothetical protein [Nanoarchaeota archaeon]
MGEMSTDIPMLGEIIDETILGIWSKRKKVEGLIYEKKFCQSNFKLVGDTLWTKLTDWN